jgi:hypothetical protein
MTPCDLLIASLMALSSEPQNRNIAGTSPVVGRATHARLPIGQGVGSLCDMPAHTKLPLQDNVHPLNNYYCENNLQRLAGTRGKRRQATARVLR